jgi:Uncharacterized protein conserved in bacteria (DUF2330)
MTQFRVASWVFGACAALALGLTPSHASACGGFFCSQAAGVNQAAERIVFAKNANDTVTAVIEIMYQGPTDKFSWLLPISSVPEGDQIAVASSLSFQRLQQATNPQYNLVTRIEGYCDEVPVVIDPDSSSGGEASEGGAPASAEGDGGVTVEAKGIVGSFDYAVISLDKSLADPAEAAVAWLRENEYDVPEGARGLLGPYLADGLYLLALKLVKGANTGSIRPIALTYEATKPMIPVKLTAVAANDDMGVMAWVLGDAPAIPTNYNALQLNEARINWFSPNQNYNAVVIAAADEAGGQGFVTEYAQPSEALANRLWTDFEESDWQSLKTRGAKDPSGMVEDAMYTLSQWDGFWDVVRKHVTWPGAADLERVQDCPSCFTYEASSDFLTALETDVVRPARLVQELIDAHPRITRLYTTLSAAEMTVDPLFSFNRDLPNVSNQHRAERIIECAPGYYPGEAPWRIELPQGGVVRGGPDQLGSWPAELDAQPANLRILRMGESGSGKVLEDNSGPIESSLSTYNATLSVPRPRPRVPTEPGGMFTPDEGNSGEPTEPGTTARGGGCHLAKGSPGSSFGLAALGLLTLGLRRRRH